MTLTLFNKGHFTKAEHNFLNLKLIRFTGTPPEVKVQTNNFFDVATINSTYLNFYDFSLHIRLKFLWLIIFTDLPVFFPFLHQLSNVVHLKLRHMNAKLPFLHRNSI